VEGLDHAGLSRKLAIISALRIGLVSASLGAVFALIDEGDLGGITASQLTLIVIAYVVSLLYALGLRLRLSLVALAYAQVVVDSMLVSLLVLTSGGIDSVFTFAYVFVVIGAAMTLYRRGTILATGASLLCLATIAVLQVDRAVRGLPRVGADRAALTLFSYSISLILIAWLASTLAENVRAAGQRLAQARSDFERLEELHAAILRSLPAGLMTVDLQGVIRFVNDAALAILGFPVEHIVGQQVFDMLPVVGEKCRSLIDSGSEPNPRDRAETSFTRPGGGTIRIGFSFAPLSARPEARAGFIIVFQDVTEIVRLKEAFERADRLAVVGKLAAGIAHEVRNPLSSMCASIDVLKDALSPPEQMQRLMDNVIREGDRINRLITEFLAFARPRDPVRNPTDLSLLVQEFADVFRHEAELAGTRVELSLGSGVSAPLDADMIRQVLWNLARNALQAQRDRGGSISISTRLAGETAEISVRDDGPGIPSEALSRIFDPFFTTKDYGTGLGLAIADSIVHAHGGSIAVSSTVGEGTEFVLRLPTKPLEESSAAWAAQLPADHRLLTT
jgi:two-component system, NtrC family, sensor histidine kinase PilS